MQRLERFPCELVQRSGEVDVVQYGDAILPLLRLDELLPDARADGNGASGSPPSTSRPSCATPRMVPSGSSWNASTTWWPSLSAPAQPSSRRGVIRRLVIDDRVTELLDIDALVADARAGAPG